MLTSGSLPSSIFASDTLVYGLLLQYIDFAVPLYNIPLTMPTAIARSVLGGLTRLHEVGALHRDAETRDVLVDRDGRVTGVDFDRAMVSVEVPVGVGHMKDTGPDRFFWGNIYRFEWLAMCSVLWMRLGV